MADPRFLLVRLGSLGDVVHALPAAAALRDSFPESQIDWVIEPRWKRMLDGNRDLNGVIVLDRTSAGGIVETIRKLREEHYSFAIDFQALYKSAFLAFSSGAPRRIGFQSSYAREGLAAWMYTERLNPRGAHKVEHNLTLAECAGARKTVPRFPLLIRTEDESCVARELALHGVEEFYVLNPGGGWRSKCWPAERYGELHRKLAARSAWRAVVSIGPGEEELARGVINAGGHPPPIPVLFEIGPLLALLRRAKFVVSADSGPLHLASALGTPVIGLYGPTDPARNGPFSSQDIVIRNPRDSKTTYDRGTSFSAAMLSITADQVVDAVQRRLGLS